jgi:hypothetical protein
MKRYFKVFKASQNSFEASAIKFQFSNNSLPIFLIETNDYLERAYANMQLTGQGNIKIFLN